MSTHCDLPRNRLRGPRIGSCRRRRRCGQSPLFFTQYNIHTVPGCLCAAFHPTTTCLTMSEFPPLKNDLLLRAARGAREPYALYGSLILHLTSRRRDRACAGMGHAPGRTVPARYVIHPRRDCTDTQSRVEFRKVRLDHEFFEICRTPALATEITVQPIRRYTGLVDAAIIFSDILVVPQALGMEVLMNPGPSFPDPLNTPDDITKLRAEVDVNKELGYVFEAITMTRKALDGEVPLIGFCGAPWTLFAYMIEGGGSKTLQKAKSWLFKYPDESKALLTRIADVCTDFLVGQVKAGAQVSQLHDPSTAARRLPRP